MEGQYSNFRFECEWRTSRGEWPGATVGGLPTSRGHKEPVERFAKEKPRPAKPASKTCANKKRQRFARNDPVGAVTVENLGCHGKACPGLSSNHRRGPALDAQLFSPQTHRASEQLWYEDHVYENVETARLWLSQRWLGRGRGRDEETITYTSPSELFISEERRTTLSRSQVWIPPPSLPAKFKRERFAAKMNETNSNPEWCSGYSTECKSDPFNSEGSTDNTGLENPTYVNLREVRPSTVHTRCPHGENQWPARVQADRETIKGGVPDNSKPPPLPKKKIIRTNSAPGGGLLNSKLSKSLPTSPGIQISNPLYGIYKGKPVYYGNSSASVPTSPMSTNELFNLPGPNKEGKRMVKSQSLDEVTSYYHFSEPQVSIETLNFDMTALELSLFFPNFATRSEVFRTLALRCAVSLDYICAKYQKFFLKDQTEVTFEEKDWPDFSLQSTKASCSSSDAAYYIVQHTVEPRNLYAMKICKAQSLEHGQMESTLSVQRSIPVHFNIQQVCGHFVASTPLSLLPPKGAPSIPGDQEDRNSHGGETDESGSPEGNSKEVNQMVTIMGEIPFQTMADFVIKSIDLHQSQPDVYEREVSLLLLQLCAGLEHLKVHHTTHCDLRPENLLLVEPTAGCRKAGPRGEGLAEKLRVPRLTLSNFSSAKQRSTTVNRKPHPDRARLAPEIASTSQYKKVDEFQVGILIYEALHLPNPFENISRENEDQEYDSKNLPQIPCLSPYSEGLQHLAHLLLRADPTQRIHIRQAKSILQALIWGPRKEVFSLNTGAKDISELLGNWLDAKRFLLMLKLGERFLEDDGSIELEDWLCSQYFAFATPDSVFQAMEGLLIFSRKHTE
uniref:Protein kinase domain-containing protein n=1 Tax=Callorhinchus milii TaxID=7868 RepID=A0A4W3GSB0_CALMI